MRLPNGFGTCYKLPGNRRKPWIARVFKARDNNGRSNYETVGYFETKKDGIEAITLRKHNPITPKAAMTLLELYTEWSDKKYKTGKKKKGISKATEDNYRAAWRYAQRYEKEKFAELRTGHWQDIIDECEENDMSRSHMRKIKTLATQLYDYAIQNDVISKNYAKYIELPREEKTKKERFTDPEVLQLEKAAANVPWVDTVLIMIKTGMRIGEMLGLTRFNIDLEQELITGGGIKTDAGKDRVIPIHPDVLPYIKKWYARGGEALICDENGKRLATKKYREEMYYPALEAAKVRKLTPHKCRHTFCSRAAERGIDTKHIQQLSGHSDYAFTANEYTHLEIETLRKAIRKI